MGHGKPMIFVLNNHLSTTVIWITNILWLWLCHGMERNSTGAISVLLQPIVCRRFFLLFTVSCVNRIVLTTAITSIPAYNRCYGSLIALKVNWVRAASVRARVCVGVFPFYDWELKSIKRRQYLTAFSVVPVCKGGSQYNSMVIGWHNKLNYHKRAIKNGDGRECLSHSISRNVSGVFSWCEFNWFWIFDYILKATASNPRCRHHITSATAFFRIFSRTKLSKEVQFPMQRIRLMWCKNYSFEISRLNFQSSSMHVQLFIVSSRRHMCPKMRILVAFFQVTNRCICSVNDAIKI